MTLCARPLCGGGGLAGRNSPFCFWLSLPCAACSTPFLWSCPKKRGGAPKKNAWGGGAPVRFRDPPASPTRVGGGTRPLRCPLRGQILSLAPRARGLGWWKSSQVKVFCPAFLQKSGRGPGAEPWPRAAARGTPLVLMKRRRGSKGEPSPGVPPLRAAPPPAALRTSITPVINERRAGMDPRPYGGWRNAGGGTSPYAPLLECKKDRDESRGPFGGGGWIRTTVGIASRFTVCPLWPLGNTPVFASVSVELVDGLEPPTC